ncbi:MAG: hypothetical protein NTY59_14070 [Alphaproteobacteria bacterium]|nr:hypothetical protein [Alphaproteobacteria bacterium]
MAVAALSTGAWAMSPNWVKLTPSEGRFTISCPTTPSHETWQEQGVATPRVVNIYQCGNAGITVVVAYSDFLPGTKIDANAELAANRDSFLTRVKATPISSTPFLYQPGDKKLPALDVEATGQGRNYRSFGIVDGDRVYQIVVGAPDAPQAAIRMQEVLRSFQLNMASK